MTAAAEALATIADQGFMSTPVTRVHDQWLGGFDRGRLEEVLRAVGLVS